ncbi:MAG TPA: ABC transporter ATP-binding protein/permease [Candidatus Enterenecus stercoripullorum]|nr:ABC transporter ATP-binding protein/permease [Candidatus Enterenecus stercoripullorum]
MLKLSQIKKNYVMGDNVVEALRGIDLEFRENEFVSILGPSGCGKTTTLNIIGGLDRYTSGDLIINGRSTKQYKDRDWDAYRNHSIGFVFQSYNLIPHQTVLANVELALTLSGVSKAERHRRAKEALEKVGLADQMNKKPNQMSGGQMQRVAIARALINDPDILLADEPTGALDSETSVQVMALLKEVAKDRLVIMVTHNPELAQSYSTRIIKLKDGRVIDDSNPYHAGQEPPAREKRVRQAKGQKTSMSFLTALSLSLNNLMTKKGRTVLTSFAGSIGIIGIALILALSSGINTYINQVQEDTLSSYPITIQAESVDMTAMLTSLMGAGHAGDSEDLENREEDRVYSSTVMYDLMDAMLNAETVTNNLTAFKAYLDQGGGGIADLAAIRYGYDFQFDIYNEDAGGDIVKSDITSLMQQAMSSMYGGDYSSYFDSMGSMYESMDVWDELMPGENGELIDPQVQENYDLLYGSWPESYDEVILFVDENNEISDLMLYALGLMSQADMEDTLTALQNGQEVDTTPVSWSYEELCQTTFKLILPAESYQYSEPVDAYLNLSATQSGIELLYNSEDVGIPLKVVGIARPGENASLSSPITAGSVGYTSALTSYAIEATLASDVVQDQLANPDVDVITGLPFATGDEVEPSAEEKIASITEYLSGLIDDEVKADVYVDAAGQADEDYIQQVVDQQMSGLAREDIVAMITQQYAGEMGVDANTITSYIDEMSDEELFAQVKEALAAQVRQQYAQAVAQRMSALSTAQLSGMLDLALAQGPVEDTSSGGLTQAQLLYLYDTYMPPTVSESTYEDNLDLMGYVDLDSPDTISLYADTFADKDTIAQLIDQYNAQVENEEDQITYTDYVALLMSSITDIISGISYLLIAFVSISLVVSSIMIGIITYISVLERTKEIGILRAVGASKRDISRVFNAETLIVGLGAGLIGIGVTLLLTIPINAILLRLTGLAGLKAALPVAGGVILVVISALLTIIAGLIPAKVAARKDPVEALRSE